MGTPAYFSYLSSVFTFLYLYIFVPLSILMESYILIAYSANMINEKDKPEQVKFRRGVAVFLPFLMSLYAVLYSEIYAVSTKLNLAFYILLLIGLIIGVIFMYWISSMNESDELFATLSCFVSSLILFSVLTVFIITRSFEIISFVFGFLFGVCIHVIRYGFTNFDKFKLPVVSSLKKILKDLQKKAVQKNA